MRYCSVLLRIASFYFKQWGVNSSHIHVQNYEALLEACSEA